MIAVLYAELMDWKQFGSRRTLVWLSLSLGITMLVTMARPDWCLAVLNANLIWISIQAGRQKIWNQAFLEDWVTTSHLEPWQAVLGKMSAVLCINLIHLMISVPIFMVLTTVWGVPPGLLVRMALLWISASLVAALLPLSFYRWGDYSDLLTITAMAGWLIGTLIIEGLQAFNPLLQTYRMMQGQENPSLICFLSYLGMATAIMLVLITQLRRTVKSP